MNIPIVFIHYTNDSYTYLSLQQARFSNPDSEVILLYDEENSFLPEGIQAHHIAQYQGKTDILKEFYLHYSPNSWEFEYRCIERWFILLEFCKQKQYETFLYLDSDVLLYTQANYFRKNYVQLPKMSISHARSPHFMWVSSIHHLEKFCNLVISFYQDQKTVAKLKDAHTTKKEGFSDMTFFALYSQSFTPAEMVELTEIKNGKTFDNNMNCADGFEIDKKNGLKKIYWKNEVPSGKLVSTGEFVQFLGLHFQGKAKLYMHRYFGERLPLLLYLKSEMKLLLDKVKTTLNKIK